MLILLHPAGYRVIITTADGTTMPFTLDPQLFVVLPKPEGSYSVSVQAINSSGLGTVENADTTSTGEQYCILSVQSHLFVSWMNLI